jgi:DNA-binding MarR family transcriptional regulator
LVELTVRGRGLEQALIGAADSVNAEAADGLSALEVETLMALLAKVAANLEAGSGRRSPDNGIGVPPVGG